MTPPPRPPRFRTRWRGYDPAEVDAWLDTVTEALATEHGQSQTAVEELRAELAERQDEIDRLRIIRQQIERVVGMALVSLRNAQTALQVSDAEHTPAATPPIGSTLTPIQCAVDAAILALSNAQTALHLAEAGQAPTSTTARRPAIAAPVLGDTPAASPPAEPALTKRGGSSWRTRRLAFALLALLVLAAGAPWLTSVKLPSLNLAPLGSAPDVHDLGGPPARAVAPSSARQAVPAAPPSSVPASKVEPPPGEGSTILLKARQACWVGATLDRTRRIEHLMQPGEEYVLRAQRDVVLRVGDAGALALTINGVAAPPLGRDGEVITKHITLMSDSNLPGQPPADRPRATR